MVDRWQERYLQPHHQPWHRVQRGRPSQRPCHQSVRYVLTLATRPSCALPTGKSFIGNVFARIWFEHPISKTLTKLRDQAVREGMDGISPRYVINRLSGALVRDGATCINPIDALRYE